MVEWWTGETMRIYLSSLGCKLNQAEMDDLAARLAQQAHELVASPAEAELCILNTCVVTHVAAQKTRQALRRLHRDNPQARLVATGCYAELAPGELEGLPGMERVVGNASKPNLAALLGLAGPGPAPDQVDFPPPASTAIPRTRALVKIQDGCDNACTYCIIHVARGPQRSRAASEILAEVRARLAAGHREIVLTGVHVGAYGRDHRSEGAGSPTMDLWGLVRRILDETDVPRLRLSSIEPWDLAPRTLALWGDARLCRHLHLPLQSGSDDTLARMGRRYTTAGFAALVEAARAAIPDLAVASDVIVGFPGETEADFAQSLEFVREMGLARIHVFPYSPRPGTPAAQMPGPVPTQVKAAWARRMRDVAAEGSRAFRRRFLDREVEVLWESSRSGDEGVVWRGLTDHYVRVEAPAAPGRNVGNSFGRVRIEGLTGDGLHGQMVD
jgi:threonylcarbamoyladenosine tRNA methylthiotransferase MtaB